MCKHTLVYLVQCYSILWAICTQTLVYISTLLLLLWVMYTQTPNYISTMSNTELHSISTKVLKSIWQRNGKGQYI